MSRSAQVAVALAAALLVAATVHLLVPGHDRGPDGVGGEARSASTVWAGGGPAEDAGSPHFGV